MSLFVNEIDDNGCFVKRVGEFIEDIKIEKTITSFNNGYIEIEIKTVTFIPITLEDRMKDFVLVNSEPKNKELAKKYSKEYLEDFNNKFFNR